MLETVWDLEIKMRIPFNCLVFYPNDSKEEYISDPDFQKIADYLNIKIDIPELYKDVCRELHGEAKYNPAISVYYADNTYRNFILIDTYRDPTDQLDLIFVCIRCTGDKGGTIRKNAHEFYIKRCKYNVIYAEGNYVIRDHYNTDFSLYKSDFSLFKQSVKSHFKQENKHKKIRFYKAGHVVDQYNG